MLGWLFLHFVMTAVYVSPDKYFPKIVNRAAVGYISPLFHQAWHLFAPNPPLKHKELHYRVKHNSQWSEWYSPGYSLLASHDRWRLGHGNIRYRMHQNAAFRLWAEHEIAFDTNAVHGARFKPLEYLVKSRGVQTARHYVLQQYLSQADATFPDSLDFKVVLHTPPDFPDHRGEWSAEVLNFPRVAARD